MVGGQRPFDVDADQQCLGIGSLSRVKRASVAREQGESIGLRPLGIGGDVVEFCSGTWPAVVGRCLIRVAPLASMGFYRSAKSGSRFLRSRDELCQRLSAVSQRSSS